MTLAERIRSSKVFRQQEKLTANYVAKHFHVDRRDASSALKGLVSTGEALRISEGVYAKKPTQAHWIHRRPLADTSWLRANA